jgi:hypothetical protein
MSYFMNCPANLYYCFGRYLGGIVPPHFQEMDESAAVEGTNVMVLPSTVLSIFATVIEMAPVAWFTEAELILPNAPSPTPKLV